MTERRTLALLTAMVVVQLLLITAQVPSQGGGGNVLESALLGTVAPMASIIESAGGVAAGVGEGLRTRRSLATENERLRGEVERLRREVILQAGIRLDLERLAAAVSYARSGVGDALTVADVVYIDHASWLQTLVISVGEGTADRNQPVVAGDGLVGRVVVVGGRYAKVQLLTDRAASVGGMIARTRRQGVVRGAGSGAMELLFVPLQADVQVGDEVISAGIDGVYPRGLPVGTVIRVEGGDDLFHKIRLAPSVDLGTLDQVYLLHADLVPDEVVQPVDSDEVGPLAVGVSE